MGISNGPWVKGGTSGRQDDFVAQVDDQLIWWGFFLVYIRVMGAFCDARKF